MMKALFKKQMLEVFSWLYKNRKTGKHRSVKGIVGSVVLYLFLFGFLGAIFYVVADMLCVPLVASKVGWLYWCLMGLITIFLGVFGSVFNTYSSLYSAKDNDFLLSLPIPTSQILFVRLFGVYAIGLMYELIVFIPTALVWFMKAPFSLAGTICIALIAFLLSVFVLVLSAILGWMVAFIAGKLKHKNMITVFLSLAFIAAYYYVYGKAYSILQSILANAEAVGDRLKSVLYPLYQMGRAAEGNIPSMLIFTAIIGGLFLIVYAVLSHSFLSLATANRGNVKKAYKKDKFKTRTVDGALLQKELRRFMGSANYMLNCGLGIIFMPIVAGMLLWKAWMIREILLSPFLQQYAPLLAVGGICMIATMNDITSPSVSLEGKNLWIAQSLPVSSKQVLAAKLKLHLLLTVLPAIPLLAVVEWLLRPNMAFAALIPVATLLFIVFMATLGLCVNLKIPNLNWTSEIVPIKQSMSVMIALFGGWIIIAALAVIYGFLGYVLSPLVYLVLISAVFLILDILLLRWLFTRGAKIFCTL